MYLLISIVICIILILLILFIDPKPYLPEIRDNRITEVLYSFNPTDSTKLAQYLNNRPVESVDVEITPPVARASTGFNKNEERCRAILEELYPGYKFITVRPDWLKNPVTGRNLELDMYNHELKIACEYDGEQHIKKTKFHRTNGEVVYQHRKDKFKDGKCRDLGITLLRVPYWVKPLEMHHFIKNGLTKLRVYPLKK